MDEHGNSGFEDVATLFLDLIGMLKEIKPSDRSELDRRIAINITDVEKAYAYFMHMINLEKR